MIATVTLNPSLDEWVRLPSLRVGQLNRAADFVRYPGGKGINVSRVLRTLGGSTVAFTLTAGADGAIFRSLLQHLSIPCQFVEIPGTTRNNYKLQTTTPKTLTEINAAGPRVSAAGLRKLERQLFGRVPAPECVVLSGSLPPGVAPTIYRRWIQQLSRAGIPTILDASGDALRQGLAARPWCIKPNRLEAEELLGRRLTTRSRLLMGLQQLLRRGPSLVLLSLGREGAVLASSSPASAWAATAPSVPVNSAVGAGDSMVAGFVMGWVRRLGLLEAFRLGVACGTAAVLTPGTELCHRSDVQRLLPQIEIRQIA